MSFHTLKKTSIAEFIECPVCHRRMKAITSHHIRNHGFASSQAFKDAFGFEYLQAPALIEKTRENMRKRAEKIGSPGVGHDGRPRSPETIALISKNRRGKGIGVCGKYERTKEIREKISRGVAKAHLEGRAGIRGQQNRVSSIKAGIVHVRSSWERRTLQVLDADPTVMSVTVEPFSISYQSNGSTYQYIPDFLIVRRSGAREIWEVKPEVLLAELTNPEKIAALEAYAIDNGFLARVITLSDIENLEEQFGVE